MTTDTINVQNYKFNIKDNILTSDKGNIYSRNFKIGGNYADCVNVSISYDMDSNPISAKIPTIVYDEECSLSAPLDRGEGTIIMIKTLLKYINSRIPQIHEFIFEDKSNIECGTEEEKHQKRRRKRGTHAVPIALYYFSIAFNGVTWYEKNFNAYQKDPAQHKAYRTRVKELLTDEKTKPSFDEFLRIAQPPMKYLDELKPLYEMAKTYGDFFKSIPKDTRCRLVRDWISQFMEHYLKEVFKNADWVIDVRRMDDKRMASQYGSGTRKRGRSGSNRYYCPEGRIRLAFEQKDMGSAADIEFKKIYGV